MKKFIAVYIGSASAMDQWAKLSETAKADRQKEGIKAWASWGERNSKLIKDIGNPLGKTKKEKNLFLLLHFYQDDTLYHADVR